MKKIIVFLSVLILSICSFGKNISTNVFEQNVERDIIVYQAQNEPSVVYVKKSELYIFLGYLFLISKSEHTLNITYTLPSGCSISIMKKSITFSEELNIKRK